ncbi:DUF1622 domain-containing protein [Streptomyces spinoverrucosus]|uniref:DUF1622 domain-containing protein n=1 Tax=Streptomyces spinoverrucosus TaxID=284043 RepID=UPI001E4A078D|nr:DUF1622 domain-containing protein [Streptomyces spinoverrucosus]
MIGPGPTRSFYQPHDERGGGDDGGVLRLRRVQPTIALLTDFLLAAGLIRLAAEPSWMSLATAAATAAVRMLLNAGLCSPAARRV